MAEIEVDQLGPQQWQAAGIVVVVISVVFRVLPVAALITLAGGSRMINAATGKPISIPGELALCGLFIAVGFLLSPLGRWMLKKSSDLEDADGR